MMSKALLGIATVLQPGLPVQGSVGHGKDCVGRIFSRISRGNSSSLGMYSGGIVDHSLRANGLYRPDWLTLQLAAVGAVVSGREMGVMDETVGKLCKLGHLDEAVEALEVLVLTKDRDFETLMYTLIKLCVAKRNLVVGRRVHALSVKMGYESATFLCNHILRMYASHARLQEAMDVFSLVANPDAFTWSAIISAHAQGGEVRLAIELYHRMRRTSVNPDSHVFVAALQACARGKDLKHGQQVHADVLASGFEAGLSVCNALVDMYAKCGSLEEAQRVFDGVNQKDVVTWTALMSGYSQQCMGQEALHLYSAMQEEGIAEPNSVTFVCLLQACASLGVPALEKGRQLHAQIGEQGLHTDVLVGCSLVNMYAKCGSLQDARLVFEKLPHKDVVTWTALIAGYSQQGMGQEAIQLHNAMQREGNGAPDSVTFVCLLQACASVGILALGKGKELHIEINQRGLQADVSVGNNLVNMYAKCGSLQDAQAVFDSMGQKNAVTWNAMIAGYSQQGMALEALRLYSAMRQEGAAAPDSVTFLCLLDACASVAAIHAGRQLHAEIVEQGLHTDAFVAISVMKMYARSGSMADAQQVFDALLERDIVAWSALIAGYTCQADSKAAFDLFHRMREDGVQPDGVTFTSLLTACSHAGLVHQGQEYFESMHRDYGIRPTVEHYSCMVDLLGRAGQLEDALALVLTMPVQADIAIWHTLLGACQKWCNVEVGSHAFRAAVRLDEKDATPFVIMSNIYSDAGMWEEAQELQAMRTGIWAWKEAGQSWWTDTDGLVHIFVADDRTHPESGALYQRIHQLLSQIKDGGDTWIANVRHIGRRSNERCKMSRRTSNAAKFVAT